MTLFSNKTIAVLPSTGSLALADPIVDAYIGGTDSTGGMRQATTVNGTGFWMSGESATGWGFRYLPSLTAGTTNYVSGVTGPDFDPSAAQEPGEHDARGVTIYAGQLYGSDSMADSFEGIFTIGSGLPTYEPFPNGGTVSTLLPGFGGDDSIWTFQFQNPTNIWAAYANETFVNEQVPTCVGSIAHYVRSGGVWALATASSPCVDALNPVYSISGRVEGGAWVVYATTSSALYRYSMGTHVVTRIATPGAYRYFRSVAVAPIPL